MKKTVSFLLALVLVLALMPVLPKTQAEAATNIPERALITLKKEKSNIAPGVTQEIGTVRKKYNGQQLVYYTMTVDLKNPYAEIHANYKDNDPEAANSKFGMQTVKAQMDAAQANHSTIPNYTVVGGINGTGYNMSTGETRGILVMEGQVVHEDMVNASSKPEGFFAIDKDKKAHIYWNTDGTDWVNNKNNIQDAINIFGSALIKNGEIVCGTGNSPNARTAIGITADNEVVMLVTDGKQAPFSEGCDMYELALILKKAGCVNAMNLDGGGSTTFVSRPEGEDTYRVINKPCDGSPRMVSASLYVASTAPDDKVFDHAAIDADVEYITPGGEVNFTAKGVTAAGTPIDIPENVTWSCDEEAGTFTVDGDTAKFVASSEQDVADKPIKISMLQDGESVGEITVHVVKPNVFNLTREKYMVPFGKSLPFEVYTAYKTTAADGEEIESEVTRHEGDVTFSLSDDSLGTLDNEIFTAHEADAVDAPNSGSITATLNCTNTSISKPIELGRGSELVFGFENGQVAESLFEASKNSKYADSTITVKVETATAADGHVHSGDHSMRVTFEYKNKATNVTNSTSSHGNMQIEYIGLDTVLKDAVGFGAWVWIPDEEKTFSINPMFGVDGKLDTTPYVGGYGNKYDEGHWEWICLDPTEFTSGGKVTEEKPFGIYKDASRSNSIGFYFFGSDDPLFYDNLTNTYVFYIDDFMVDYSLVTPDRAAPTIGDVKTGNTVIDRGEVFDFGSTNVVSFNAEVTEDSSFNATGIDPDSLKVLIDGNEVSASFTNGQIVVPPVTVADGVHTLKMYISDKADDKGGNTTSQTRQFEVNAGSKIPTVQVVARKTSDERVLMGGVCYADVIATDVSKIQQVELVLDLINNADWEIKHANVNPKFTMSEPVIDPYENIATVTFTRTKAWEDGDSETIASLPIRAWNYTYEGGNTAVWNAGSFSPRNIELDVDRGTITYVDGYTTEAVPAFGMEHLKIETEMFGTPAQVKAAYPGNEAWHSHSEATLVEEKPATCTENGYRNRKECPVCHSPVNESDWGEVISALGHDYKVIDGVMKCSRTDCGVLFNGVVDGKTYVNGLTVEGWQEDGTYYVDGKPLGEGLHKVKDNDDVERWHLFGENGVCDKDDRAEGYSGYYTKSADGVLTALDNLPANLDLETNECYYIASGEPFTGWLYFRKDGSTVDPNKSTETVPSEDEDSGETSSEGTDSETKPGVEPGMPDPEQQQAIIDIVAYHIHEDGRIHSVSKEDTRKCVESGYILYTCNAEGCGETEKSEKLWWVGHDWDENHVCKREDCKFEGMDIGEASLNIMGENFEYTGSEIRAAVLVYYKGLSLSVRSDKNGLNGYVSYKDNKDIGVATVHIRGEGDFYGELEGTFNIVPQSVKTINKTESVGNAEGVTINLTWAEAPGADYYTVIRYDYEAEKWIEVGENVETNSFSETLPLNLKYYYQVASRAYDKNGDVFYAAKWSNPVSGTVKHVWGEEMEKVEPQCEVDGSYKHTCTLCGYEETVTVPATGHTVEEWETVKEATYTEAGMKKGTCTVCKQEVTEEIPKLPPVQTGTGNTTSPDAEQETVTNPDGSKTTTTTTKDGTVTETTEQTDGTVTEKITEKDGTSVETTTTPEGVVGTTGKDASGNVTNAEVTVPQGGSEGVVKAPVEVPSAGSTKDAPQINVHVQGEKSVKMEVPVTDFGPGTVAVVVHPDGTEEVVRDCVVGEDGVILNVEGDVTLKIVENSAEFNDIERVESWAGDAIEFTSARELFSGTGNNNFQPDGKMSRGALVTLLYRLSYEPEAPALKFGDVDESSIYADAVAWADSNSIVSGYGNGTFMPDNVITREQLVTLIYQYAQFKGVVKPNTGNINTFTDADKVSSYAKEAMAWAIGAGIVSGQGDNTLNPTGSTTRAQTAVILMKLCDYMAK